MAIQGTWQSFTQATIDAAPDKHGVYALSIDSEIVYYGRASGDGVTIKSRLADHKAGRSGNATAKAANYCAWEVTGSPIAREKELLEEFQSAYGTLPRGNDRIG